MLLRNFLSAALLFVLSQALFLFHIQFPDKHNFDEFHYVPAAKELVTLESNRNEEHPPLGKFLIGVGIKLDQDRPFGWRIMSALFGTLTLIGVFALVLLSGSSLTTAWVAALLTLFNQILFVQARIAMLDTFMVTFLIWAFVFLIRARNAKPVKTKDLIYCGIFLGLATACKWVGALGVITCMAVGTVFFKISLKRLAIQIGLVAVGVYFVCCLPLLFVSHPQYHFTDLFSLPYKMWVAQKSVQGPHPYHSVWYQWATLQRPMWYAFDKEGNDFVRGVILLGNPLIMWSGLIAGILISLKSFVKSASRLKINRALVMMFCILFFSWAFIPRQVSFYYYYFPASCFLGIFIARAFEEWREKINSLRWIEWSFVGLSIVTFFFFYPILAALKIPLASYLKYMWFRSWI